MTVPVLCMFGGLAFILAEALLPSGGILSMFAALCVIASLVFAFRESNETGLNFLGAAAVLVPLTIVGGMKLFPKTPLGKQTIRTGLSFDSSAGVDPSLAALLGTKGALEADCRPAGIARFAGRRVDVVSRGEWLTKGATVEVIEVQGNRVIVRGLEEPTSEPS